MRTGWIVSVLVIAAACGGKKDDKPAPASGTASATGTASASASGTASAAGTASASASGTASGTAAPAAAQPAGLLAGSSNGLLTASGSLGLAAAAAPAPAGAGNPACQAACDHRASCGLGDAAACNTECSALLDVGTIGDADLQGYAAAACDQVKQAEPQFELAAACRGACAHRATCVQGASVKDCIPDCATLVLATKQSPEAALDPYVKMSCEDVQKQEPVISCLHACTHVLQCGVPGDLPSCLGYCQQQLGAGATVEQVDAIGKADCDQVKANVQLPQPTAQGNSGGGGGGGHHCTAEGQYKVCEPDGTCQTYTASETRGSTDVDEAKNMATQDCTFHLGEMVLNAQINNRASQTQSCQITQCD